MAKKAQLTAQQKKQYAAAGGAQGTGMSATAFKKWFAGVQAKTGMTPAQWAASQGMKYGGVLQKGVGQTAGVNKNVFSAGDAWDAMAGSKNLSDAGKLKLINSMAGTSYGSLGDATRALGPAQQMAGLNQYVLNQMGESDVVRANPYLQNASMVGLYDPSAFSLFMGALVGSPDAKKMLADRAALVPDWMPGVQDTVMALGNPALDISMLADPSIMRPLQDAQGNVTGLRLPNPSEPLFGPGDRPPSLPGALGSQAGEASFARSLSPQELLQSVGPLDQAYYHRAAGAPVPEGFEPGLSFGNPVWQNDPTAPGGGHYSYSPLMGLHGDQWIGSGVLASQGLAGVTDPAALATGLGGGLYNRWGAYGQPGTGSQNVQAIMNNWPTDPKAAAFWAEPQFAPWQQLTPEVIQRFLALAAKPTTPSWQLG